MSDNRLRIRTYRQVWHLEQVLYRIDRVNLPFPITFRQIGVFGASLVAMSLISRVPPVDALSPLLRYIIIPAAAAWYLTNQKLDGKLPHRWLISMLRYWTGPKRLNRLQPLAGQERVRLVAQVGYRKAKVEG